MRMEFNEKQNNFNILRLIFSSTVIISHSFPLTNNEEFFLKITSGQIDLGYLSVHIFFVISGFLIFRSLWYSKSIVNYIWKRLLRLFPGLLLMLILTLITLTLISDSMSLFHHKDFYTYLPKNLTLFKLQSSIKNIFENNPYPKAINGSLWTLHYEFAMYMLIIPLAFFKNIHRNVLLIVISIVFLFSVYANLFQSSLLENAISIFNLNPKQFYPLLSSFLAGTILSLIKIDKIKTNMAAATLTILLLLSVYTNTYKYVSPFMLPLLIIIVGLSFNKYLWMFTEKLGDISYGVYIYGFVVQQTLMNFFSFNPIELMISALAITYLLAYISWHWVEKRALEYKNYV